MAYILPQSQAGGQWRASMGGKDRLVALADAEHLAAVGERASAVVHLHFIGLPRRAEVHHEGIKIAIVINVAERNFRTGA